MTAQEHAPVVVAQTGAAAPAPEHPVIAHLRARVEEADRRRLDLATKGGHARQAARRHEEEAARFDDEALAAHAQMDTWQALLEAARVEVANEQRKIDAIRRAAPAPEQRPTMVRCNGCGLPVRPAWPHEHAAAAAGQPAPDLRPECPRCRPAAFPVGPPEQAS